MPNSPAGAVYSLYPRMQLFSLDKIRSEMRFLLSLRPPAAGKDQVAG